MTEGVGGFPADNLDPNEILDALLARVEEVIHETSKGAGGMPYFAVKVILTEKLREVLPEVRFTDQDIRAWAAQISS